MRIIDLLEAIANGDSIPSEMYFEDYELVIQGKKLYLGVGRGCSLQFFEKYDCSFLFEEIRIPKIKRDKKLKRIKNVSITYED